MTNLVSVGHTAIRYSVSRRHVAALIFSFILAAPIILQAACPPFTKPQEMLLLEQLAKYKPKDRPLTDTELLKLVKSGDIKLLPLQVLPASGPAPLTINVAWYFLSGDSPFQFEIDLDGNGLFKPVDAGFDRQIGVQIGNLKTHLRKRRDFSVDATCSR